MGNLIQIGLVSLIAIQALTAVVGTVYLQSVGQTVSELERTTGVISGSWSLIGLTALSLCASVLVARALRRRFVTPVQQLLEVMEERLKGDTHVRCHLPDATPDLHDAGRLLNQLLGVGLRSVASTPAQTPVPICERSALLDALDRSAGPVVLVDSRGIPVAMNRAALDERTTRGAVHMQRDLQMGLTRAVPSPTHASAEHATDWRARALEDGTGHVCTLASDQVRNLMQLATGVTDEERIDTLLRTPGLRLERIVSEGNRSPEDFWYDQDEHEWVFVLRGHARLEFEQGHSNPERELRPGDHVWIPAHQRHRVKWTAENEQTIWLALFLDGDSRPEMPGDQSQTGAPRV